MYDKKFFVCQIFFNQFTFLFIKLYSLPKNIILVYRESSTYTYVLKNLGFIKTDLNRGIREAICS